VQVEAAAEGGAEAEARGLAEAVRSAEGHVRHLHQRAVRAEQRLHAAGLASPSCRRPVPGEEAGWRVEVLSSEDRVRIAEQRRRAAEEEREELALALLESAAALELEKHHRKLAQAAAPPAARPVPPPDPLPTSLAEFRRRKQAGKRVEGEEGGGGRERERTGASAGELAVDRRLGGGSKGEELQREAACLRGLTAALLDQVPSLPLLGAEPPHLQSCSLRRSLPPTETLPLCLPSLFPLVGGHA
jgi:hypothetical protein